MAKILTFKQIDVDMMMPPVFVCAFARVCPSLKVISILFVFIWGMLA